ncbi:hypothetical protein DUI87_03880 [Hirundo rustica rustica]|uniref:Uncharacterized protein n=1 Tax=Hirundo rustica rustica TaxID=333673 RepID=A0A3M0L1P6_HIRRU|nr:hypothetical protein DUI87_03880 [Hirundo rustica rustica]
MDKRIRSMLSKHADDTKMNCAADTSEGQDPMLGQAREVGPWESHGGQPPVSTQAVEQIEGSPAEKDLGMLVEERLDMTQQ